MIKSFPLPVTFSSLSGLAFDGAFLWFVGSESFNKKIYKIDLSGNLVSTYDFLGSFAPKYMTFGNSSLWCIDDFGTVYQFDLAGNKLASFDLKTSFAAGGLIYDGNHLWIASSNKKLIKFSTTGTVLASYDLSGTPDGLAFDGTYLWVNSSGDISKFDLSGNLIFSYSNARSGKLAFDGNNVWITGYSSVYKLRENIAAIELGGSEIRTFTVTNNGSAVLSITNIAITGADVADFTLQNNACTGKSLNTFDTCKLDVRFQPTTSGLKKATLEITSNDLKAPTTNILLSGGKPVQMVSQCSRYAPTENPPVSIPCVNVNGQIYSAGLTLVSSPTGLRFEANPASLKPTTLTPNADCAVFPYNNRATLRLNCIEVNGNKFWAELGLVPNMSNIQFDLIGVDKQ